MKKAIKVVVIGGGSSYTPEIVEGFIQRYPDMPLSELWLVDVPSGQEKLSIVGNLAKRMIDKSGLPIELRLTLDRRSALEGADFVTTQIRVGQLEARRRDEEIPLAHGVIGQETTGPGGMMKAFRTIPVLLDICRDIEELCPDAWLLNFTNPAGMVTEAVSKYSRVKSIGLCNAPIGFRKAMAKVLQTDVSRILPEFVGINHLHWITALHVDGENKLEKLLNGKLELNTPANVPHLAWDAEFLRGLGAIPSAYLRYYYMRDEMLREQQEALKGKGTRAAVVQRVERELFELYKDPNLDVKPPQLELRGGAYYSEAAVNLMRSLYNDTRDIQTINVPNGNTLSFLPPEASIEVNCVITAAGPLPLPVTRVPREVQGLLHAVKTYESLAVDAAVHGDRDLALQAIVSHPLVPSISVGKALLRDLLDQNEAYLPRFFPATAK
ncbi:6-phospho-beta-glucosidase [Cohnella sp. GCM10027633]|uniref:6-phospho-beta-glucosidase n=1 Tax=unclassified Cohnella TaxID=2636738 RepID=UPI0036385009